MMSGLLFALLSLTGVWDATINVDGLIIPFRMELAGDGSKVSGTFFNGDERITSSSGKFDGDKLVLDFDYYGSKVEATLKGGAFTGNYFRFHKLFPITAKRHAPSPVPAGEIPSIAGQWEIEAQTSKGEPVVWPFVVRQSGAEVTAAILRIDGDTGALSGSYRDGKFVLSHFSGARPARFDVTPNVDGTLSVVPNGGKTFVALRPAAARAKGLPEPPDPTKYTGVRDPLEPLHFSFPDLNGKLVSDTDARFKGKVVIVTVGGSWCPNCHDEAPLLMELYRKYHAKGLEIVDLSFEDADELKHPVQVPAFIKRYGIEYPVLLAGETSELNAKLPQAINLQTYPASFFIGRDGLVKSVHAGFASVAMGDLHRQLRAEITELVEELLAAAAPK
jgi:thiol-disulfide isomerase/thioredoxin